MIDLPSESDFDPCGEDLDAQHAWKNFGDLTIDEAYEKFSQVPYWYTEDFTSMGNKAFEYYSPVLIKYLENVLPKEGDDYEDDNEDYDCEIPSIGFIFETQLDGNQIEHNLLRDYPDLKPIIFSIANEVFARCRAAFSGKRLRRIERSWTKVFEMTKNKY